MTSTPPLSLGGSGVTVLLFGPQALSFSVESLQTLRTFLHDEDNDVFRWMLDAVSELPVRWRELVARFPKLEEIPGEKLLDDLKDWLLHGTRKMEEATFFQLPNIVLTPLVVLTQLAQFSRFLSRSQSGASPKASVLAQQNIETVGLCTGLLSASAVSSSSDQESFRKYGAVAIRLAMVVGALVDAQDASDRLHGLSKSFAVGWGSPDVARELIRVLDCFPEAYISVLYDEKRATLTTAEGTAPLLLQQLKQKGVTANEVGLRGRFHSQCHHDDCEELIRFCDSDSAFQFPDISQVGHPIHLNGSHDQAEKDGNMKLHHAVLRMILVEQAAWHKTFAHVLSTRMGTPIDSNSVVVSFGPDRGVPPSLLRKLGPRLVHAADADQATPSLTDSAFDPTANISSPARSNGYGYSGNDIAVVSMACQVAGASDVNEFWDILCAGESQHVEVSEERFGLETQWRDKDPKRKWYGNFIKDHDVFDHRFFKKSPREIQATDPQQRLMLQCAYQAVEQSGYFHQPDADTKIGCFLGACAADYEHNVACYAPNAFTATGNLKSFIAGKISHYFGWTGPGLTIDTACSASAVAIHQACRAIIGGECNGALAGGVGLMGNITWFQNLAGASFLSPTGACKPWDEKADGYCRGEAVALVFLKRMSDAIVDGNQILGCISSTAVYQNENCTPVFVPNSPSLSYLFRDVLHRARLEPKAISVVEAHGTGTPVGDPAEYESVLQALGGPLRDEPLALGSVKGLIGHTEGASGVVSLIKVILMIQEGYIPPQASFQTLSHHIRASPLDNMEIVTELKPWNKDFRAALINNYGASGSNASLVVTQPWHKSRDSSHTPIHDPGLKHVIWLCGLDDRALRDYSSKLRKLIRAKTSNKMTLANLSFNICRQSNRNLDKGLIFSCSTVPELDKKLSAFISGDSQVASISTKAASRPVILCFGGQISTFVGLDKNVYDSVKLLRSYLDQCNAVFLSIGLSGIYPGIFQREPVADAIQLQTMLFALQYACAKCWADSGVKIAAVVGHSFGELTALCISGVLSLKDAVKMIAARAKLWKQIIDDHNKNAAENDLPVEIACFNGPRSFTLAGATTAVDRLTLTLSSHPSAIRFKRLNVTNAFHSALVEPLMQDLEDIGTKLTFREPSILLERSTEGLSMDDMTSKFVAQHMRNPVYFYQAVQRLAQQHPEAVWLEAGSNSTITVMAGRALGSPSGSHFQSVNITTDNGLQNLCDSTLALWKAGIQCEYWPHHAGQTYEYDNIFLPPYQFDKTKHWMDLKKPVKNIPVLEVTEKKAEEQPAAPITLWTFLGYQDKKQRNPRFHVNTSTEIYNSYVSGHWIAQTAPICPATVEVDMAIEALMSILPPSEMNPSLQPTIHNMQNHAPICVDPSREVFIDYSAADDGKSNPPLSWDWKIISVSADGKSTTEHVHGKIVFRCPNTDTAYRAEFDRYTRFVTHEQCLSVLYSDADEADIIQGRNIYKTFAEIVDYGESYRGLKRLVGLGNECAGRVLQLQQYKSEESTWLDAHLSDSFSQVGGIWVNCMTARDPSDMYIASGCELVMRSPDRAGPTRRGAGKVWDVFARHHLDKDAKGYTTDIFVFDGVDGGLVEVMLGIRYAKVAKASMQRILARLSPGIDFPGRSISSGLGAKTSSPAMRVQATATPANMKPKKKKQQSKPPRQQKPKKSDDLKKQVRNLLANISGLEPDEIANDCELADIGIDSLMGMELAREIETVFSCTLPLERLAEVVDFPSLVDCLQSALPASGEDDQELSTSDGDEDDDDDDDDDDESLSEEMATGGNLSGTSTPPSSVDENTNTGHSGFKVDIIEYLTDLLGVGAEDILDDTVLIDLGVDSLLSTELRSDLASKFEVNVPEDVSLEGMSVAELNGMINGASSSGVSAKLAVAAVAPAPASTPTPEPVVAAPARAQPRITSSVPGQELKLSGSTVLDAFGRAKLLSDHLIREYKIDNFAHVICPKSTQLCIALTLEAFEKFGVSIKSAKPGQIMPRVQHASQHRKLVEYLYDMLEYEARLIDTNAAGQHIRTAISPPSKSSQALFSDLLRLYPNWSNAMKLTQFAGTKLADVLIAKTDGIKIIFGSEEGRTLVGGLYCDHVFNKMSYHQMAGFIEDLISTMPPGHGPLKILEMGAGTGGTTLYMAPLLERLGANVEYTFTDLSASMVAAARKKFKKYPFMKFLAHDIEKPVPDELLGTQHVVIASNAVHATHDLVKSGINIRNALRPDGFLMMLEMTEIVPFVDIIFGLLEGWWLFDDGRKHAIIGPTKWEEAMHKAGFGHVDWSDGYHAENKIQKVIIAMASGPVRTRLPLPSQPAPKAAEKYPDLATRERDIANYVSKFSAGFTPPTNTGESIPSSIQASSHSVLITGATGSLGTHLVKELADRDDVQSVICINRRSNTSTTPLDRQMASLQTRGVTISDSNLAKLQVFETDSNKPNLGLAQNEYTTLTQTVTAIVHNAWPMSGNRPIKGFEAQFRTLSNLINLGREASAHHPNHRLKFQLISSIGVVGHYPLWNKTPGSERVPEKRMDIRSVLPNGYCDAKFTCERILDETLHKYPEVFDTMTARLGQIAGSRMSGYWNPMEHWSFMVKSSQNLRVLPELEGALSWCPVNDMATALGQLLLDTSSPEPIYHIDNPRQQPWSEMIKTLVDALGLPRDDSTVSFDDWVSRVRRSPLAPETDNPAARLIDFVDDHFRRMSCGGLVLDTAKACRDSPALAAVGPVSDEVVRRYISAWKDMGFLN
ncbi:polyketide synthase [Rhypophila decipiens]